MADLLTQIGSEWANKFGAFAGAGLLRVVSVLSGTPTDGGTHAETHLAGVTVADAEFSADIVMPADRLGTGPEAHVQFRISDEGRYGVRLRFRPRGDDFDCEVDIYQFLLPEKTCSNNAADVAHCPLWPEAPDLDLQQFQPLASTSFTASPTGTIPLKIVCKGSTIAVEVAGHPLEADNAVDLTAGRLGLYVFWPTPALFAVPEPVLFTNIQAASDGLSASNFALLYSTVGYDLHRTKRAVLRTLAQVAGDQLAPLRISFNVMRSDGQTLYPNGAAAEQVPNGGRTLGFQAWVCDFSDLKEQGDYRLEIRVPAPDAEFVVRSEFFPVAPSLLSSRVVKPLSIDNARARRAADDDFRRNWVVDSGRAAWNVGVDGAFVADAADDGAGATLRRVFDTNNRPLNKSDFRFRARVTIISGCDAQLQFLITGAERWGVTLQAGAAGGCSHGDGPGAVRLHWENVEGAWKTLAARPFPELFPEGFLVGQPYDVEVRVGGGLVVVDLNGMQALAEPIAVPASGGQFGLKAWASSVRFERVQAWSHNVAIFDRDPGIGPGIAYAPTKDPDDGNLAGMSAQGVRIYHADNSVASPTTDANFVAYPYLAQHTGFHDCNNLIGEATSHSIFLAGLMDVWSKRAHEYDDGHREGVRDAIVAAVLYLFHLFDQGLGRYEGEGMPAGVHRFAHQEPGRAIVGSSDGVTSTQHAIYGLSSFAAYGVEIDRRLVNRAMVRAKGGLDWLRNGGPDPGSPDRAGSELSSIVLARLAIAAQREPHTETGEAWNQGYTWNPGDLWDAAEAAAYDVAATYAADRAIAVRQRECLRSLPWFEGLCEVVKQRLGQSVDMIVEWNKWEHHIQSIATQLRGLLTDSANALQITPQATDEADSGAGSLIPEHNWDDIADIPLARRPIPETIPTPQNPNPPNVTVGDWYISEHFATASIDCTSIGQLMTGLDLEPLATGNLHWILGLNPGIAASKTVTAERATPSGPWQAASFIYNGPGRFARTIEGNRSVISSSKGWLAPWEESASSRHRETWWIDPGNTTFNSIVNGHVLRDGQWDYWSIGPAGWISAESFLLIDGSYLKAAIALEDWISGKSSDERINPYPTNRFTFLDTTHTDRLTADADRIGLDWSLLHPERCLFDDPNRTPYALAVRTMHSIAREKGYQGGIATGHRIGERIGAIGIPVGADVFDIDSSEIARLESPFTDIDTDHWSVIARTATELAVDRRYRAGYFTGDGRRDDDGAMVSYQLICFDASLATPFAVRDEDIDPRWSFDDIDTVHWAKAARAATDAATRQGFVGGFFTGYENDGRRWIAGLKDG